MKKHPYLIVGLFLAIFICHCEIHAQNSSKAKLTAPYDSLTVTDVKAKANKVTGSLELTVKITNISHKHNNVHLVLGSFDDFGIISMNGSRYKVFTSENVISTGPVNKGYYPISTVQFGTKKLNWVTSVVQELNSGEERLFSISIGKFDKKANIIKNLHFRCILTVNYMHAGDNKYVIENIPIEWLTGALKTK
jgi:hypothetical protein